MNFLYWNTCNKDVTDILCNIILENEVDIAIISENKVKKGILIERLNEATGRGYTIPFSPFPDTLFIINFPSNYCKILYDDDHLSVKEINTSIFGELKFLLFIVHLPSKLHLSDNDQSMNAFEIANLIHQYEAEAGHKRSFVLGDFNMNPF